jgi:hypothetical protein
MGRKLHFVSGAAAGAALQYLFDPQRGRSRRARLGDQAAARIRDLGELAGRKARYRRGKLKGLLHEISPGKSTGSFNDDDLILQRIRSQVIGPLGGNDQAIGLRVAGGVVVLTGKIPEPMRIDLVKRIGSIEGVRQVEDQLSPA